VDTTSKKQKLVFIVMKVINEMVQTIARMAFKIPIGRIRSMLTLVAGARLLLVA
jgi:hypothetical protein